MVRAVFKDGEIQPLAPPPPEWGDGRELWIEEANGAGGSESLEAWFQQFQCLTSEIDPADVQTITNTLADADNAAKQAVRREMGLSE